MEGDSDILNTLKAIDNALLKAARIAGHGRPSDGLPALPLPMRQQLLCITRFYKIYRAHMNYGDFIRNLNLPTKDDNTET
jgi:hypothetical protein